LKTEQNEGRKINKKRSKKDLSQLTRKRRQGEHRVTLASENRVGKG